MSEGTSVDGGPKLEIPPADTMRLVPLILRYVKWAGGAATIWAFGYFNCSISWVLAAMFFFVFNREYKKIQDARRVYARSAAKNEQAAIMSRIEDLPSWVIFPDIEKAEWLNKMIKQMWPFIDMYVEDLLREKIEPEVQASLPKSLTPFKFEKIDLGDTPLRIGGVKVYTDNVKRDEIIMDMEIMFASDSNIKVAVRGFTAGIKDLQIHGTMRVVMRPLVKVIPIVGGINVFFLNPPKIDFDLTDVANVLDFPLLSNTLRSVVEEQISHFMVLPNKIPIQLAPNIDLARLKYPQPQGVLRIHIVGGRDLKKADVKVFGKGKSDPYCKVYVGAQIFKTKVIQNTVSPHWNEFYEAVVDQKHGQFMEVECLDEDPGDDDDLGTASIDIQQIASSGSFDAWIPLENVETGMVHIRALWMHLSKDPNDLQKADKYADAQTKTTDSEDHLSSAILFVFVDSAKNVPRSKKSMVEPSPYVKLSIGNTVHKTLMRDRTTNPVFDQNAQFLVHHPHMQNLVVEMYDGRKGDDKKKIGACEIKIKELMTARDMTVHQPYHMEQTGTNDCTITLRLCLRVLTSTLPADWALDLEPVMGEPASPEGRVTTMPSNTTTNSSVARSPDSELRQRKPEAPKQSSAGNQGDSNVPVTKGYGAIELTLRYTSQRGRLVAVVHRCQSLIPCDEDNLADPYVRLNLLPEKSSSNKRKTQTAKNTLNPIFDETFEWTLSQAELVGKSIEVSVKNSVSVFSKNRTMMGDTVIDLGRDLTKAVTAWYTLEAPQEE